MPAESKQEEILLLTEGVESRKHYGSGKIVHRIVGNVRTYGILSILGAGFAIMAIRDGLLHTRSIYEDALKNETSNHDAIASIATTELFISGVGAPFASVLISKKGPKVVCCFGAMLASSGFLIPAIFPVSAVTLFLSLALLLGVGLSFLSIAVLVGTKEHFIEGRFLALAIVMCGGMFGRPIVSLLAELTVSWTSWATSFLCMSVLSSTCALLGQVFTTTYVSKAHPIDGMVTILRRTVDTSRSFYQFLLILLADCLVVVGLNIFTLNLEPAVAGLIDEDPKNLENIFSIATVVGMLISGLMSDNGCHSPVENTTFALFLTTIIPVLISVQNSYIILVICTGFAGILLGFWRASTNHVLVSVIGLSQFTSALGLLFGARSLASLGAPILIKVSAVFGDDLFHLYASSLLFGSACITYAVVSWFRRRHSDIAREELGMMEWDNKGEEWDQEEFMYYDDYCESDLDDCEPCDSPCPQENGKVKKVGSGDESCVLSCDSNDQESFCKPCDDELGEMKRTT